MFFGSAIGNIPDTASPRGTFLRDLAASVAALGALGALLVAIQFNAGQASTAKAITAKAIAAKAATARTAGVAEQPLARQPSDEAAVPDADEERVASAMVAFALSKVSPKVSYLQPEALANSPAISAPSFTPVSAPRKTAKPAPASPRLTAQRIPAGLGQGSFRQVEWPERQSALRYAVPPSPEQFSRFSLKRLEFGRYAPDTQTVVSGAQSLATGTRKAVGASVAGLRSGVSAMQERAVAITARLW